MNKTFAIILAILFFTNISYSKNINEAYFAGGCFWCVEEFFEKTKGVEEVISGYSGGELENPTYKQVAYEDTGHFETVKIIYDANIIIVARQTKSNAYTVKKVSFEENKTFNKSNVEKFINFHKKKLR